MARRCVVTVVNVVMGTLVAWVLVRDDFRGKPIFELVIDVPVRPADDRGRPGAARAVRAREPASASQLANTRVGIFVALLFVTVPFVVRAVQPVLMELDRDVEEAGRVARREPVHDLPPHRPAQPDPAIAAGAALSFARALGEYGSLVLMSGSLPFKTEVASVRILGLIENDNLAGAAAVATVLLVVPIVTLLAIDVLQRWAARRA